MLEVPVYLFTGFLESGKTKFIQGFLEDERFQTDDNTLLLVCEEGVEEYDSSKFKVDNVFIEYICRAIYFILSTGTKEYTFLVL